MLSSGEYQRKYGLVAVALGIFCVQLDSFALNLALPDIGVAIGSDSGLSWTISAYLLTVGALMPVAGRRSDVVGRKWLLVLGLLLFGFGSSLCGTATSLLSLVVSRVLQGAGGAIIMPVGIAFVTGAFPEEERGRALGRALAVGGIATACGPFVGGVLTEFLSWRAVFWLNIPFCLAAAWWCRRASDTASLSATTSRARLRLPSDDAASAGRSLLRNGQFVGLTVAGSVANAATVVFLFVVPIYLHDVWSFSPLESGVVFLTPAMAITGAGPLSGRVRAPSAKAVMSACLACAAGALCGLAWSPDFVTYFAAMTICGGALGLANALTLVGTQAVVTQDQAGLASGVTKTAVTVSGGLGALLIGPVVARDALVWTALLCCNTAMCVLATELWLRRRAGVR